MPTKIDGIAKDLTELEKRIADEYKDLALLYRVHDYFGAMRSLLGIPAEQINEGGMPAA